MALQESLSFCIYRGVKYIIITTMYVFVIYIIYTSLIFLVNTWFRFPKDITDSVFMPDKLDLPIHAGQLLKYFKNSNASLLSELDVSSA